MLCAIVIPVLGFIGGGWLDATIYTVYAILIWCSLYRADTLRHMNATGKQRVNCTLICDVSSCDLQSTEDNASLEGPQIARKHAAQLLPWESLQGSCLWVHLLQQMWS